MWRWRVGPGSDRGGKSTGGRGRGGGSQERWKKNHKIAQYFAIGKAYKGGDDYERERNWEYMLREE